jgi:hypothetical protein
VDRDGLIIDRGFLGGEDTPRLVPCGFVTSGDTLTSGDKAKPKFREIQIFGDSRAEIWGRKDDKTPWDVIETLEANQDGFFQRNRKNANSKESKDSRVICDHNNLNWTWGSEDGSEDESEKEITDPTDSTPDKDFGKVLGVRINPKDDAIE